jgi:hypothetical protein
MNYGFLTKSAMNSTSNGDLLGNNNRSQVKTRPQSPILRNVEKNFLVGSAITPTQSINNAHMGNIRRADQIINKSISYNGKGLIGSHEIGLNYEENSIRNALRKIVKNPRTPINTSAVGYRGDRSILDNFGKKKFSNFGAQKKTLNLSDNFDDPDPPQEKIVMKKTVIKAGQKSGYQGPVIGNSSHKIGAGYGKEFDIVGGLKNHLNLRNAKGAKNGRIFKTYDQQSGGVGFV